MKAKEKEKDFQQVANDYGRRVIEGLREELDALEHAQGGCSGEVDCDACAGHGKTILNGEALDCAECGGTGLTKCDAGKDSDHPEAWHDEDRARQRIDEGPLSVEVRGGWHAPGAEDMEAEDYCILLGTGGPASRIVGDLRSGQPSSARFEYQDWFKPWTEAQTNSAEDATLLEYAQQFYFGE